MSEAYKIIDNPIRVKYRPLFLLKMVKIAPIMQNIHMIAEGSIAKISSEVCNASFSVVSVMPEIIARMMPTHNA